jgi:hypothetical protein
MEKWKLDPEEQRKEKNKTTTEELFEKQLRIICISETSKSNMYDIAH